MRKICSNIMSRGIDKIDSRSVFARCVLHFRLFSHIIALLYPVHSFVPSFHKCTNKKYAATRDRYTGWRKYMRGITCCARGRLLSVAGGAKY